MKKEISSFHGIRKFLTRMTKIETFVNNLKNNNEEQKMHYE